MHMAMMVAMIMIKKTATAAATALAGPPPSVGSAFPSNVTAEQMISSRSFGKCMKLQRMQF